MDEPVLVKAKARSILFFVVIEHLYTTVIRDTSRVGLAVKMLDRMAEYKTCQDCDNAVRVALSAFYDDLKTVTDATQQENLRTVTRHFLSIDNPLEIMAAMVKSMNYFDHLIFVNPALTRHIMTSI